MAENKVQLILEAFDKTKEAFSQLEKNLKGVHNEGKKVDLGFKGIAENIKTHWLAISAAIAGAALVINKAWNLAEMSAKFEEQKTALNNLASQYNSTADSMIGAIQRAADGTIDKLNAVTVANKGLMMGLNPEQLSKFVLIAKGVSDALGTDIANAFQTVTQAAATGQERQLKQLGILIDLQGEYKKYAASVGKTADELSEQERQTIGVNAIMEKSGEILKSMGEPVDSVADKFDRFKAMISDFRLVLGDLAIKGGAAFINVFMGIGAAINYAIGGIAKAISKIIELGSYLSYVGEGFTKAARAVKEFSEQSFDASKLGEEYSKIAHDVFSSSGEPPKKGKTNRSTQAKEKGSGKGKLQLEADKAWEAEFEKNKEKSRQFREEWNKRDIEEAEAQLEADKAWEAEFEKNKEKSRQFREEWNKRDIEEAEAQRANREAEINYQLSHIDLLEKERKISKSDAITGRIGRTRELLEIQKEDLDNLNKEQDTTAWYTQADAIQKTSDKLVELNFQMKEQTGTALEGMKYGLDDYLHNVRTNFQQYADLARTTAQSMESAFSDVFFDAMTNKLKTLADYVNSFLLSIQRAIANMMAQQVAQGIVGGIGNLWSPAKTPSPAGSYQTLTAHKGGYLVPKFHIGGLAYDEIPAILQRGEYVVSKKGVDALNRINQGNVGSPNVDVVINVENKTGMPVKARQTGMSFDGKKMVKGIMLELMATDPNFKNQMGVR